MGRRKQSLNGQCWVTGGKEGKAFGQSAWKTLALKETWEMAKLIVPGGAGGTYIYLLGWFDQALGK